MTGAKDDNFQNTIVNLQFSSSYIYNIKKSLSIIYTEENPAQGDSPREFDDAQDLGSCKNVVETPTTGASRDTPKPVALPSRLRD